MRTFRSTPGRRSRRVARCLSTLGTLSLLASPSACRPSSAAEAAAPDPRGLPRAIVLTVTASPDSALKLAKFALGSIEGVVQLPQVRPQMVTVANHMVRNRDGGGQTQIAVIAAVDRKQQPGTAAATLVELSVWILDMPHQLTQAQRRAGVPSTPITTNAPAIRHPRAMTPRDTTYWKSLEVVADAMMQHGARRTP